MAKPRAGITLLEVATVVAVSALLNVPQFANNMLTIDASSANSSAADLQTIGVAVQSYCNSTNKTCGALTNGLIGPGGQSLPIDFLGLTPTEPGTGATYTISFQTAADGVSRCFSLEGTRMYPNDAVTSRIDVTGAKVAVNASAPGRYLHFDSLASTVYSATDNNTHLGSSCTRT
jgi:hypothetical protein